MRRRMATDHRQEVFTVNSPVKVKIVTNDNPHQLL